MFPNSVPESVVQKKVNSRDAKPNANVGVVEAETLGKLQNRDRSFWNLPLTFSHPLAGGGPEERQKQ